MAYRYNYETEQREWVPDEFADGDGDINEAALAAHQAAIAAATPTGTGRNPLFNPNVKATSFSPGAYYELEDDGGDGGSRGGPRQLQSFYNLAEYERANDAFINPVNAYLRSVTGQPEFNLYGSSGPVAFGEYRGLSGLQGNRLFGVGDNPYNAVNRNSMVDSVVFSPEQKAARAKFEQMYPGYAQVNPGVFREGPGGKWGIQNQGESAGMWLDSGAMSRAKYDPEFGLLVPVDSFGFAGQKGGIFNDSFGQGLLMLASAAAPFVGAHIGGVALDNISKSAILKGAAVGGGIGAAASGGDPGAIIKGIIGGATAPVSGAAANALVGDILPAGGITGVNAIDNAIQTGLEGVATGVLQNPAAIADPTKLGMSFVGGAGKGLLDGGTYDAGGGGQDFEGTYTPDQELAALGDTDFVGPAVQNLPVGPAGQPVPDFTPSGQYGGDALQPTVDPQTGETLRFGAYEVPGAMDAANVDEFGQIISAAGYDPLAGIDSAGLLTAGSPTQQPANAEVQDFEGTYTEEQEAAALEDTAAVEESAFNTQDAVKLAANSAKSLYQLYKMLNPDSKTGEGPQLPERREGQSEEEYQVETVQIITEWINPDSDGDGVGDLDAVVQQFNLDVDIDFSPEHMASLGYTPGSPEYIGYVLNQIEEVISQLFQFDPGKFDDEGFTPEEMMGQLRNISAEEAEILHRLMSARSTLGAYSYSTSATDPFSGDVEELGGRAAGGRSVEAAGQRGNIARLSALAESGRGGADDFFSQFRDYTGRGPRELPPQAQGRGVPGGGRPDRAAAEQAFNMIPEWRRREMNLPTRFQDVGQQFWAPIVQMAQQMQEGGGGMIQQLGLGV